MHYNQNNKSNTKNHQKINNEKKDTKKNHLTQPKDDKHNNTPLRNNVTKYITNGLKVLFNETNFSTDLDLKYTVPTPKDVSDYIDSSVLKTYFNDDHHTIQETACILKNFNKSINKSQTSKDLEFKSDFQDNKHKLFSHYFESRGSVSETKLSEIDSILRTEDTLMRRNKRAIEELIRAGLDKKDKIKLGTRQKLPKVNYGDVRESLASMKDVADTLSNARINSQALRYLKNAGCITVLHSANNSIKFEVDSNMEICNLRTGNQTPTHYKFLDGQIQSGAEYQYQVQFDQNTKKTVITLLDSVMLSEIRDTTMQLQTLTHGGHVQDQQVKWQEDSEKSPIKDKELKKDTKTGDESSQPKTRQKKDRLELIVEFITIWNKYLKQQGNDFYHLQANHETLIVATLLKFTEDTHQSEEFQNNTQEGFKESIRKFIKGDTSENNITVDKIASHIFTTQKELFQDCGKDFQLFWEFHGLNRIFGHAVIDPLQAVDKTTKVCTNLKSDKFDPVISEYIAAMATKLMVLGYLNKEGRLPEMICQSTDKRWSNLNTNKDQLQLRMSEMPLYEQMKVKIIKIHEFDVNVPPERQLKDKSVSLPLNRINDLFKKSKIKNSFEMVKENEITFLKRMVSKGYIDDTNIQQQNKKVNKNMNNDRQPEKRRLMLRHIETPDSEYAEILTRFKEGRLSDFEVQDWVILMTDKEREMKISSRLFGVTPFPLRQAVTVGEDLVKSKVMKQLADTTMTMDGVKQKQKLESFTSPTKLRQNIESWFFNTDFEKWNLNFTFLNTAALFHVIDLMLNAGKFQQSTHLCLSLCRFVYNQSLDPMEILNPGDEVGGKQSWGGEDCNINRLQVGGVEGLRQKCWSVLTIALLRAASEASGIPVDIISQGDNCIVQIFANITNNQLSTETTKSKNSDVDKQISSLLELCEKMEVYLKRDESYVSKNFTTQSKILAQKGQIQPQTWKKLTRSLIPENASYPVLESALTACTSCATTSLSLGSDYQATIQIMQHHQAQIIRNQITQDEQNLVKLHEESKTNFCEKQGLKRGSVNLKADITDEEILLIVSGGKEAGFFPTFNFIDRMCSGINEKLGSFVHYWKLLSESNDSTEDLHIKLQNQMLNPETYDKKWSVKALLMTSSTLPIKNVSMISGIFKKPIEDFLKKLKNIRPDIKSALDYDGKLDEDVIKKLIKSLYPCYPRILASVWNLSTPGIKDEILNQFAKSNSVRNQIEYTDQLDKKVMRYQLLERAYLINRITDIQETEKRVKQFPDCTRDAVEEIKSIAFKDILDSDLMLHPAIPACFCGRIKINPSKKLDNSIHISQIKRKYGKASTIKYTHDPSKGMFSSKTSLNVKVKIQGLGYDMERVKNLSNRIKKLIDVMILQKWCNTVDDDENLLQMKIKEMLLRQTDVTIEDLNCIEITVTGDMQHRQTDSYETRQTEQPHHQSDTANYLYSSEQMNVGVGGVTSWNLNHTQLRFHVQTLIDLMIGIEPSIPMNSEFLVSIVQKDCNCIKKLNENKYDIRGDVDFSFMKDDSILYPVREILNQIAELVTAPKEGSHNEKNNLVKLQKGDQKLVLGQPENAVKEILCQKIIAQAESIKNQIVKNSNSVIPQTTLKGDFRIKQIMYTGFIPVIKGLQRRLFKNAVLFLATKMFKNQNTLNKFTMDHVYFTEIIFQIIDQSWHPVLIKVLEFPSALNCFFDEWKNISKSQFKSFLMIDQNIQCQFTQIGMSQIRSICNNEDHRNTLISQTILFAKSVKFQYESLVEETFFFLMIEKFFKLKDKDKLNYVIPNVFIDHKKEKVTQGRQDNLDHRSSAQLTDDEVSVIALFLKLKNPSTFKISQKDLEKYFFRGFTEYTSKIGLGSVLTDVGFSQSLQKINITRQIKNTPVYQDNIPSETKDNLVSWVQQMERTDLNIVHDFTQGQIKLISENKIIVSRVTLFSGNNRFGHIHSSHKQRHLGSSSQSHQKYGRLLSEIMKHYFYQLILAEGRGTITMMIIVLNPKVRIHFYTLMRNESIKLIDFTEQKPAELNNFQCSKSIENFDSLNDFENDLGSHETCKRIVRDVKEWIISKKITKLIILSDLEITNTKPLHNNQSAQTNIQTITQQISELCDVTYLSKIQLSNQQYSSSNIQAICNMNPSEFKIYQTPWTESANFEQIVKFNLLKDRFRNDNSQALSQDESDILIAKILPPSILEIIFNPNPAYNHLMKKLETIDLGDELNAVRPSQMRVLECKMNDPQIFEKLIDDPQQVMKNICQLKKYLQSDNHYMRNQTINRRMQSNYAQQQDFLHVITFLMIELRKSSDRTLTFEGVHLLIERDCDLLKRSAKELLIRHGRTFIQILNCLVYLGKVNLGYQKCPKVSTSKKEHKAASVSNIQERNLSMEVDHKVQTISYDNSKHNMDDVGLTKDAATKILKYIKLLVSKDSPKYSYERMSIFDLFSGRSGQEKASKSSIDELNLEVYSNKCQISDLKNFKIEMSYDCLLFDGPWRLQNSLDNVQSPSFMYDWFKLTKKFKYFVLITSVNCDKNAWNLANQISEYEVSEVGMKIYVQKQ